MRPSLSACDLFVTSHCDQLGQSGKGGLITEAPAMASLSCSAQPVTLDPNASLVF